MQTIGERLSEARKKRGATLQDAAKETKIREEYLAHLEKNDGIDIPLERIYVRGFLRNYARFLRMDTSRLLTDFDANAGPKTESTDTPKSQKELIGRLELGTEVPPTPTLASDNASPLANAEEVHNAAKKPTSDKEGFKLPLWALPVAIGFLGVLLVAGVVLGIGSALKAKNEASLIANNTTSEIKIRALGDVTVIVKQVEGETTLFAGSLKRGEEKILKRQGSVRVQYSEGNLLEVEKDGKRYKMGSAGAGKRVME